MSKALTHETHYRERTGSHSTKGSKRGVNLLNWDADREEEMRAQQERDALRARAKQINEFFCTPEAKRLTKAQRAVLAQEYNDLCSGINAIRPKMQSLTRGRGVQYYLLDVLKERLPKLTFQSAYEEAVRRLNTDCASQEAA
jgi:hypothetical protein